MEQLKKNLEKHLHELCLFPSRHVGSPGVKAAADYVEKTFRELGFKLVAQEPFPSTGWRFGSMRFADLDNACREVPGALPCFFSRSTDVSGVPVWLDRAALDGLKKEQVENKLCIVDFFSDAADIRGRNGIAEELDSLGAAAAVFISDPAYHTPCAASTKIQRSAHLQRLGAAAVAQEGAFYLAQNRHHRYHLCIDADTFAAVSHNVTAVRPGTGLKRAVFGAHIDAAPLTQGAGDNASGTACLLEMARLLKEELPDWTFDFAAFDAEEYCITHLPVGSEAYVQAHPDRRWYFFMDFDNLGAAWGEQVLHLGREELLPELKSRYPFAPFKNGGDDRSFDALGIPTLWYNSETPFKVFHTPLDTVSTLDISKMADCIADAVAVTRQLCR
ncbi:MAG: M28 family peptidase [Lentisphaeria bacterium]|nr:M28 family peptidase [Lentisphaeria bacterium]